MRDHRALTLALVLVGVACGPNGPAASSLIATASALPSQTIAATLVAVVHAEWSI